MRHQTLTETQNTELTNRHALRPRNYALASTLPPVFVPVPVPVPPPQIIIIKFINYHTHHPEFL